MKCENCIHYGVCVVNSYCHEPCGYYEEDRPRGEWKNRNGNTTYPFWERYECAECNSISGGGNFCNHCGADMREEGERNDNL